MQTVVITGVGRGIGRALAEKFLAEGFRVLGTTLNGQAEYAHPHLELFTLDLRDSASIAAATVRIRAAADEAIDIIINNAGVLLDDEETVVVPHLLSETLAVNLIGAIDFTERVREALVPGGHIVNISSTAGSLTLTDELDSHYPGHYPAYKISKVALNMYTRTLAVRLRGESIVSSVNPGWVKTEMGGEEAEITPGEAAQGIFNLAISKPETGQFWFKKEKLPW